MCRKIGIICNDGISIMERSEPVIICYIEKWVGYRILAVVSVSGFSVREIHFREIIVRELDK